MKVTNFMYCEEAKNINNKLNITGPLNVFAPPFIPGTFSFCIAFGILGIDLANNDYLFQVKFIGPNDEILVDSGKISIGKTPEDTFTQKLPVQFRGMTGNMDLRNVILRSEGEYKTQLFINDDKIGEFPIPVVRGENNA